MSGLLSTICVDVSPQDANAFPLPLDSGHIGDKVSLSSFTIADNDRVAGKSGVEVTFVFTPSVGGRLVAGAKISLNFPLGFFASSSIPDFESSTLIDSTVTRADWFIEIQLAGGGVMWGNQSVCITVDGMVMGSVTSGNTTGIAVLTSQVRCQATATSICSYLMPVCRTLHCKQTKLQVATLGIVSRSARSA